MSQYITEIDQVSFDTVLIGSSLTNCITFAALSRAGKRVLLLDPQGIHGYTNSTVTLKDYHNMINNIQRSEKQPVFVDLLADLSEDIEERQNNRYPTKKRQDSDNNSVDDGDQIQTLYTLIDKSIKRYQKQCEYNIQLEEKKTQQQGAIENKNDDDDNNHHCHRPSEPPCPYITSEALFETKKGDYTVFPFNHMIQQNNMKLNDPKITNKKYDNETSLKYNNLIEFKLYPSIQNQQNNIHYQPFPLHNAFEYISTSNQPISTIVPKLQKEQQKQMDLLSSQNENDNNNENFDENNNNNNNSNNESDDKIDLKLQQQTQLQTIKQLISKHGYRYNIDLIPHSIYSKSLTIKTLLYAKIHEYVEFRSVNRLLLLLTNDNNNNSEKKKNSNNNNNNKNINYLPWEIPSSKNEIFVDPILSIKSKHRLTNLFLILLNDEKNAQTTTYHLELYQKFQNLTLYHLLYHLYINSKENFNNSSNNNNNNITTIQTTLHQDKDLSLLIQLLLSGICQHLPPALYNKDSMNILSLKIQTISIYLKQHIYSIGKYTKSPLLYPMYGIGELSQAWIRNGCVWGGLAVLRTDLSGIILPNTKSNNESPSTTDNNEEDNNVHILLSSGQILTTNTLVIDRCLSPLFFANNDNKNEISLSYSYKDYTKLYDQDFIPNNSNTNEKNENNNNVLSSSSQPLDITHNVDSNIITTQHITLILDKLPIFLTKGYEYEPENISIQIFQISQNIVNNNAEKNHNDGNNNKEQFVSKYITIDDTNGMSVNGHYMVYITTTLTTTHVSQQKEEQNNNNNIKPIINEFRQQIDDVTTYIEQKHNNNNDNNIDILYTLPQLSPFMQLIDENDVKILYIGTYCQTNQIPIIIDDNSNNNNNNFSSSFPSTSSSIDKYSILLQPKLGDNHIYKNILITIDPNPSITSPDNYILQSQVIYYNIMEYLYNLEHQAAAKITTAVPVPIIPSLLLKYSILPFLMTKTDDIIINQQTGEILDKLEHRNPHLAHVIDVIDELETKLGELVKQEEATKKQEADIIVTSTEDDILSDHTKNEKLHDREERGEINQENNDQTNSTTNNQITTTGSALHDDNDDIFATLDNLDLSELDNFDF